MPISLTTELDAVNAMLESTGNPPVDSLSMGDLGIIGRALRVLREKSREVQVMGLHCNTLEKLELSPDINGRIHLPANTVEAREYYTDEILTFSQGILYDKINNTEIFDHAVECNVIILKEFDDLTEVTRQYIKALAVRAFQNTAQSDQNVNQVLTQEELRIYKNFAVAELRTGRPNILDNLDMRAVHRHIHLFGR